MCLMSRDIKKNISILIENGTSFTTFSPAEEYFNRKMLGLQRSKGIEDLGYLKSDLVLCLAMVYLLMYICIFKGVQSTGKAVYVTAILPYIILLFLLIHGKIYLKLIRFLFFHIIFLLKLQCF